MPGPIDHSNPDIALLRQLLNRRPKDIPAIGDFKGVRDPLDAVGNPELPSVPHPSGFRPDPIINGSPRLANAVNDMFKIAPELRGRVDQISTAPTPGYLASLSESDIDASQANFTNLAGQHTPAQKRVPKSDIWLRNETHYPEGMSLEQTLGHEMGHIGGIRGHGYMIPRDADMDMIELLSARAIPSHER
jgi:hypothetical protein